MTTSALWTTEGAEYRVLAGHEGRVRAAAFSPDGQLVATASSDTTARIWNVKDGSVAAVLEGHMAQVMSVAFSADSRSIVTASRDRTARIWNVEDGAERAVLRDPIGTEAAWSSSVTPQLDGTTANPGEPELIKTARGVLPRRSKPGCHSYV